MGIAATKNLGMKQIFDLVIEHIEEIQEMVHLIHLIEEIGLFKYLEMAASIAWNWLNQVFNRK